MTRSHEARWLLTAVATAWALAAPADAAVNLLQNPTFDNDLAGWANGFETDAEWSSADELGSPTSGSARVVRIPNTPGSMRIVQCFPVTAGKTYVFGADGLAPSGATLPPTITLFTQVLFFAAPNCNNVTTSEGGTVVSLRDSWGPVQGIATAPPGTLSARLDLAGGSSGPAADPATAYFDNAFVLEDETCAPTPTVLCLNDARFRVIIDWEKPDGGKGYGRARPLTADSGFFWFFNSNNIEIVGKLHDACGPFDRFWFFGAGLTNVGVRIQVTDTLAGVTQTYDNPVDTAFVSVQDTQAFATCP
jgi:hypothetical protein